MSLLHSKGSAASTSAPSSSAGGLEGGKRTSSGEGDPHTCHDFPLPTFTRTSSSTKYQRLGGRENTDMCAQACAQACARGLGAASRDASSTLARASRSQRENEFVTSKKTTRPPNTHTHIHTQDPETNPEQYVILAMKYIKSRSRLCVLCRRRLSKLPSASLVIKIRNHSAEPGETLAALTACPPHPMAHVVP